LLSFILKLHLDNSIPKISEMNVGVNKQMAPPVPPAKTCGGKKEVRLNSMPWFHGKITREEAETLLKAQTAPDGTFLVRESTNFPGDYTLCVCYQKKVEHYRVIAKANRMTIDEDEFFENLSQLVAHYRKDADGLCTELTQELKNEENSKTGGYHDVDLKAFKEAGWVIEDRDIEYHEKLGKGEFGDVMLATYKGQKVAIKTMKEVQTRRTAQFLAEATVMTSLQHDNLVCLLGIVLDNHNRTMKIVTEFMSKGSLLEYLRSRGRQYVTKKDQIKFATDACKGMEYLESQNVIHRDLAARNILISESDHAKVSDFGLALHNSTFLQSGKLPIKWTAPEALREHEFSSKSDMWSFGVLLWEIYSFGRVPYPRIPLADVVKHVEKGYKMEAPEGCPKSIYDVMKKAWNLVVEQRPNFKDVRKTLENLQGQINRGQDSPTS